MPSSAESESQVYSYPKLESNTANKHSQRAQPSQTQPSPSLTASYIQLDNRQPNPQDSAHHLEKDKPVKQAQEISINQTTYNQTPATPRLQVVTYPKLNQIQTTNQSAITLLAYT